MPVRRGTSNGNQRGSAADRARRKEWLIAAYRADQDILVGTTMIPACRCYRCGRLLWWETITVDRIKPGCQGGTYRRDNIRPACARCNSETGGRTRGHQKLATRTGALT